MARRLSLTISCVVIVALLSWHLYQHLSNAYATVEHPANSKQHFVVTFTSHFNYQGSDPIDGPEEGSWNFEGILRGIPVSRLPSGTSYRCLFDQLTIKDSTGLQFLSFSRLPNHSARYRIDPAFTENRRAEIFDLFQIDFNDTQASDDQSLLQQTFSLFLGFDGRIKEVELSKVLRDAVHDGLENSKLGTLIQELLTHPDLLPSLFPDGGPQQTHWQSNGAFIEPMTFDHEVIDKEGNTLKVVTQTESHPKRGRSSLGDNTWKLIWHYNGSTQSLTYLDIKIALQLIKRVMHTEDLRRYDFNAQTSINFENPSRAITEEEPL